MIRRSQCNQVLDRQPVLPGVERLIDEAGALDIPVGIASGIRACAALDAEPGQPLALEELRTGSAQPRRPA